MSQFKPILLLAILALAACDKNPSSTDNRAIRSFNRQSSWKYDTLSGPQIDFYRIWAASPRSVVVAGEPIRKYNGVSWSLVPFLAGQGGPISGLVEVNDVWGFSETQVWVVGRRLYYNPTPTSNFDDSLFLAWFNGTTWTEIRMPGEPLYSIWGTSATDFWVGGQSGQMFHFDGSNWKRDSVNFRVTASDFYYFSDIVGLPNQQPYAMLYAGDGRTGYWVRYLMRRSDAGWNLLDSLSSTAYDVHLMWISPSGQLYGSGNRLSRWNGAAWFDTRPEVGHPRITRVFGTADDNFFAVGSSGYMMHFNGSDWFENADLAPDNTIIYDAWTDGSSVFMLATAYTFDTIVIHN